MKRLGLMLISLLFPVAAFAQTPTCEPFEIVSLDGRVVATHDEGDKGPSIGDIRVGERIIGDKEGRPIGEVRWKISLLDPDHDGKPSHNLLRMFFLFDNGSILADGIHTPRNDIHDSEKVSAPKTELVVLGGTGAFRHARGVIDLLPADDGNPEHVRYEVDISCK
ncbi:MAG: hypothetical protein AAGA50_00190 [Pseudomonadota bacterium]